MNEQEWNQWLQDARSCLRHRYSDTETDKIIQWFRRLKGGREIDLVGQRQVEAFLEATPYSPQWNLYNSLMARLWIYAPHILDRGDT